MVLLLTVPSGLIKWKWQTRRLQWYFVIKCCSEHVITFACKHGLMTSALKYDYYQATQSVSKEVTPEIPTKSSRRVERSMFWNKEHQPCNLKRSVGSFSVAGRLALSLIRPYNGFSWTISSNRVPCYRRNPH